MEKIAAEFEVVGGVVVAGTRKDDEDKAEGEARSDPPQPAARPAGIVD